MSQKLVLIHTVAPLVGVFAQLGAELLPGVQLSHLLDEPLRERFAARGRLAPEDTDRLLSHVRLAAEAGAAGALVTCSTLSLAVDEVAGQVALPVFKIDEAMVAQAVERGPRIGVVATAASTLGPSRAMLEAQAGRAGREVQLETLLVAEALPLLLAGDGKAHDRLVRAAVLSLAPRVDVVVLAQASMARVLAVMQSDDCPAPILSSPYTALRQVRASVFSH
jgi:Asp/Glu/hydantoin racemase